MAQTQADEDFQREYELSLVEKIGDLTFQPPIEVLPKTKRTEELQLRKQELLRERKEAAEAARRAREQEEAQKRMKEQEAKRMRALQDQRRKEEERKRREEEEQRKQLEGGLDRILEALNNNTSAASIGLGGIELGSVRLRLLANAIKDNTSCQSLDLGRKNLHDEDGVSLVAVLKDNKHLEKLELEGNNLGIKTARALGEALAVNQALRCLNLESNNITSSGNDQTGVIAIAEALETNKHLRVLNLARNQLTLQGGERLVKALGKNDTVTLVDLSGNELGVDQLRAVEEVVQRNRARLSDLRRRERRERFRLFNEEFLSRRYDMEVEAARLELDAVEERRLERMKQKNVEWRVAQQERVQEEIDKMDELMEEYKDRYESRKGKKGKKGKKK
jgi:Ran GTPase-activating protein (RanGAP) involved in mRNA processing and transport